MITVTKSFDVYIDIEEIFENSDGSLIAAELENHEYTCIHDDDMLDAEELDLLMQLLEEHTNTSTRFVIREKLLLMRYGRDNLRGAA